MNNHEDKTPPNTNVSWRDILSTIFEQVDKAIFILVLIGGMGGFILYIITDIPLFRRVSTFSFALPIILFFLFGGCVLILCFFRDWMPGRGTKIKLWYESKLTKLKNLTNESTPWKDKLLYAIVFLWVFGGTIGIILYDITGFSPFKWLAIPNLAFFSIGFFFIFVVYIGAIIFGFLCLIPSLRKKFGVEDKVSSGGLILFLYYMIASVYAFGDPDRSIFSIGFWMGVPMAVAWAYEKLRRINRKDQPECECPSHDNQ